MDGTEELLLFGVERLEGGEGGIVELCAGGGIGFGAGEVREALEVQATQLLGGSALAREHLLEHSLRVPGARWRGGTRARARVSVAVRVVVLMVMVMLLVMMMLVLSVTAIIQYCSQAFLMYKIKVSYSALEELLIELVGDLLRVDLLACSEEYLAFLDETPSSLKIIKQYLCGTANVRVLNCISAKYYAKKN